MKRTSPTHLAALAILAAGCAGCGATTDQQARLLIVPARWPGQFMEVCTGGSNHLVKTGRLTSHYKVQASDGTEIDTWLIMSRLYDKSADNEGSYFETKLTRGTVVLLHPLLAGKAWFLRLGEELADRGWDVVLMDSRGHGFSGGQYVTWGAVEKKDVKTVVDYLLEREPISDRIYACGSSMGGGVAIQYAAIEPRCRGVIAMAPPADVVTIFRRMLFLLPESRFEASLKRAGELAGFDPSDASTVAAARKLTCPLVVVHGGLDPLISASQCQAVFEAADGPRKLITVRYAGHIVELGRDGWLANQMDSLAAMKGEKESQLIALGPATGPDAPRRFVRLPDRDVVVPRFHFAEAKAPPAVLTRSEDEPRQ